jgi:hypothetical protein
VRGGNGTGKPTQMNETNLIWNLTGRLNKIIQRNLAPDEQIIVKMKGAFNEALVCTDRRVMIIKSGFMTGNMFGSDIFQVPYVNITGAQVNTHLLTGYFEVSAGRIQNQPKSYWQTDKNSPQKAPNCISLNRKLFDPFRSASNLIMEYTQRAHASERRRQFAYGGVAA